MVDVLQTIWAVVACVLAAAMCVTVVYFLFSGRHDREREEEAREYFAANGHWPDEA
jgi:flagellar basal body-associated protein FliL